ncbi:MAG TPA: nicotinate-nicotinamide nucleotide adenylyltransferase [Gaiellaceae bacterium]|nr:nicotinate-nicotinamide nucleotide adenylyltransferase [Gaiellaceae bacterium]
MGVEPERAELGLLGGVFDPPHNGHVALAWAAVDHFGLERLLVLVNDDPGHKRAVAPAEARLQLARLAFDGVAGAEVALDRHPRTVDLLEELEPPKDAIFVLGADELAGFETWKRPERVLELVRVAVAMRPGVPVGRLREARTRVPAPDRILSFEMEQVPVSSSEVRDRVARGEPVVDLVPERVAEAIARLRLYREPE